MTGSFFNNLQKTLPGDFSTIVPVLKFSEFWLDEKHPCLGSSSFKDLAALDTIYT